MKYYRDTSFLGIDETGIYEQPDRDTGFLEQISGYLEAKEMKNLNDKMARGDVASNDLKQQIKNLQNSIDNNMKEIKKVIDLCGLSTSSTARFYSKINNEYILRRAFFTVIITFLETKLALEREIDDFLEIKLTLVSQYCISCSTFRGFR
ncbi:unnamed protein product [Rhizophagus irregularis]|nr:unnamed protein product [Rhizophagus irregularis]